MKGLVFVAGLAMSASVSIYAAESNDLRAVVTEMQAYLSQNNNQVGKCTGVQVSYDEKQNLSVTGKDWAGRDFSIVDTYDKDNTVVEILPNEGNPMIKIYRRLVFSAMGYTYKNYVFKPKLTLSKMGSQFVNMSKSGPENYMGTLCEAGNDWANKYQDYYATGTKYAAEQAERAAQAAADAAQNAYDEAVKAGNQVSAATRQKLKEARDAAVEALDDAKTKLQEITK